LTSGCQCRFDAFAILACGVIGAWRCGAICIHAEYAANQADCPHCGVYARFTLVEGTAASAPSVRVRCRACAHQWSIDD